MTAAALPIVGLLLLTQARAQTARNVRLQMLRGRTLNALESMALDAQERGVANDLRVCGGLLQITRAANDDAPASPARA